MVGLDLRGLFQPMILLNSGNAFEPGAHKKQEASLPHLQTTSEQQQWLDSRTELHHQLLQRTLKPMYALLSISKYPH